MSKATIRAIGVLWLATVVYYWKVLLVRDFSLLLDAEGVNQAYAWFQFWILSIRRGVLPLWDPYTWAGHSFIGEMQTSGLFPLNLVLTLFSFNRNGMFSPQVYHWWYATLHFAAACFMFALVRELGLRRFPAMIAALCFTFTGLVAHSGGWPDLLASAMWLPLIVLFLIRALRAGNWWELARNAALSGLFLGLATLAGRIHMVMMEGIVVVTWTAYTGFTAARKPGYGPWTCWLRPAAAAGIIVAIGAGCGAIQILPSFEYSRYAIRYLGGDAPAVPAAVKIPYAYLNHFLYPQGWTAFVFPSPANRIGAGEVVSFYVGIFPLLAAIIAIWKCRNQHYVRYLSGLAIVAVLYSFGPFSPLHGLLYTLVPKLWIAREPSRFLYLTDFALAILAAVGIEKLLWTEETREGWRPLERILNYVAAACLLVLTLPAVFVQPVVGPWIALSLVLVLLSYLLFRHILGGGRSPAVCALVFGLVLFDLNAFDWSAANKIDRARSGGRNFMDEAVNARGAARFLKSRPGLFRVHVAQEHRPNIGALYQVPTVNGWGATITSNFDHLNGRWDLLNVRYIMQPASASDPGEIYHDAYWKVYENRTAFPRAWIVHETSLEPSAGRLYDRLGDPQVDLRRVALLRAPLGQRLEPLREGAQEDAVFSAYETQRFSLNVRMETQGLLVLSEMDYPGWKATVNGVAVPIHEVDGGLRGVVVPRGESRVVMEYAPRSVAAGAAITATTFLGALLLVGYAGWRGRKRESLPAA